MVSRCFDPHSCYRWLLTALKPLFPWSHSGGNVFVVCYGFLAQLRSLQETSAAQMGIYKAGEGWKNRSVVYGAIPELRLLVSGIEIGELCKAWKLSKQPRVFRQLFELLYNGTIHRSLHHQRSATAWTQTQTYTHLQPLRYKQVSR